MRTTLVAFAIGLLLTLTSSLARATAYPCTVAGLDTALKAGGAATFTCAGPTTLVLSGTRSLAQPGMSLDGGGLLTISGGDKVLPLQVNAGVSASMSNMTIEHGASAGYAANLLVAGTLSLTNSTIRNGQDGFGGAIYVDAGGTLNADRCTVHGNTNGPEGSIAVHGTATLVNTTISEGGRGVVVRVGGSATVIYSTINVGSEALFAMDGKSGATVGHSLLVSSAGVPSIDGIDGVGIWSSLGYNMLSQTGLPFSKPGAGDQFDVRPTLGALADNGGATLTHALLGCSPGINAGATTGGPKVDQRGALRLQNGAIDIGAYETNSLPCLYIDDVSAAEGDSGPKALTFPVRLSGKSTLAISAAYSFADGTATTADVDYTATGGTVSFAAGATSSSISAQMTGDISYEPNETISATLSKPTNAVLADPSATGTITNDDAPPAISIADVSIAEGTGGTTTVDVTVSLSKPPAQTVTVGYATVEGTATAGEDFTAASGVVTFAPTVVTQTISLSIAPDTVAEANEAFTVVLTGPAQATIANGTGTVTINDDEGTPGLSIGGVSIAEGNAGTATASITVTLSPASATAVTVDWATVEGTATAGDYTPASSTLTFAPGETSKSIAVDILGDVDVEADESFIVRLSNATGASIATADGAVTITNDDVEAPDADAGAGADGGATDPDAGTSTPPPDAGGTNGGGSGGRDASVPSSPSGSASDAGALGLGDGGLSITPGDGGGGDDCSVTAVGASVPARGAALLALGLAFVRRRRRRPRPCPCPRPRRG